MAESDIFVGRSREMQTLADALDSAGAGTGKLVLVAGEPGIGKTRLAGELAALARQRGMIVAWGRSWETGGAPPYWPWIQIMRSLSNDLGEELDRHLGQRANVISRIVPEIVPVTDSTAPMLRDVEQDRFVLLDAVASFFGSVSRDRPLSLILDGIETADEASLHLLYFVARTLPAARILLIATSGPVSAASPIAPLLGKIGREGRRIDLGGLDKTDVAQLFREATGHSPPHSVLSTLYSATSGNPLFVHEALRLLQRDQMLTRPDHSLGFIVPEGARHVLERRLAPLSDDEVRVLSIASVIGREFDFELLNNVAANVPRDRLASLLRHATEADVVTPVQGFGRYRFTHPLLREILYEAMTSSDRMRLHRDIGEALEDGYRDSEAHVGELAHHFFKAAQAGSKAKTIDYCVRAAEAARSAMAYEEAARLYARALKVVDTTNAGRDQRTRIARALREVEARAIAAQESESETPSSLRNDDDVFVLEGEYWCVAFGGKTARLKDSKGMRYLAVLLQHPGREIHTLELVRTVQGSTAGSQQRIEHGELPVGDLSDAGEILDPTAKAQYRRRLQELREELEEAEADNDLGRIERAQVEVDALTEQLAGAVGLGGRDRKAASYAERARMSVGKAIKAAVAKISVSLPPLGEHLAVTLKAGVYCSYTPDPRAPISWRVKK